MADPISILGTVSVIASLIDLLRKTTTSFIEFRSHWQDADLSVRSMETQLTALSSALSKIKDWIASCSDDPHHQLAMDLDRCVICCRVLIHKLDSELSKLQMTAANSLEFTSKFRLLIKTKEFEHLQSMIEKQTAAVTLLLTACNTTTLSLQQQFLRQPETRRGFNKVEADIASLRVLRDVDSVNTQTDMSISSSKRSIIFEFDPTLFVTQVYQRWIRGSIRRNLAAQQGIIVGRPISKKDKKSPQVPPATTIERSRQVLQGRRVSSAVYAFTDKDQLRLFSDDMLADPRAHRLFDVSN